ncbi:hypothetical protein R84981_002354 [Carnimonas sp. R-84981]|uniref:SMUG2 DNA glycosylase family protein n=1 Tax=Carnimonas bestiolae TaxID=3402172 RepID=UPI003EDBABA4
MSQFELLQGNTFGERVVNFNLGLRYDGPLPEGFRVINPFLDNPDTPSVMRQFYDRFYADNQQRRMLIGINPSRHGAAVTGVPFTDTKRLESDCGISVPWAHTHEVSSVFVYDMIRAYGGAEAFYRDIYINSPFPLAIVRDKNGKEINANYYDDKALFADVEDFMIESMRAHIALGIDTRKGFVLGKKNRTFLDKLNKRAQLFDELVTLEHPRYIQQYKSKDKPFYIDKYIRELRG